MKTKDFTQTLKDVIENITDYNHNNPTTRKCWMCVKDGKVKYISLIKQNWSQDLYCISFYSENKKSGNIRRTSSVSFSLGEVETIVKKVMNTIKSFDEITPTKLSYL